MSNEAKTDLCISRDAFLASIRKHNNLVRVIQGFLENRYRAGGYSKGCGCFGQSVGQQMPLLIPSTYLGCPHPQVPLSHSLSASQYPTQPYRYSPPCSQRSQPVSNLQIVCPVGRLFDLCQRVVFCLLRLFPYGKNSTGESVSQSQVTSRDGHQSIKGRTVDTYTLNMEVTTYYLF